MAGIFISYRKEDTRPWAISLRDHLVRSFGERQVFLDIDSLDAGSWRIQIESALERCAVVLVLIGRRWAGATDGKGRTRVFLPDDVHRLEVVSALSRPGITVIPILVDGATLPAPDDLPEELRGVLERQVGELSDARDRREADLRRLTRTLECLTGQREQRRRATAALVIAAAGALANTLISSSAVVVAASFLGGAVLLVAFSAAVYWTMSRERMKGAWIALAALALSAAVMIGSTVRLVVDFARSGSSASTDA